MSTIPTTGTHGPITPGRTTPGAGHGHLAITTRGTGPRTHGAGDMIPSGGDPVTIQAIIPVTGGPHTVPTLPRHHGDPHHPAPSGPTILPAPEVQPTVALAPLPEAIILQEAPPASLVPETWGVDVATAHTLTARFLLPVRVTVD